MVKKVLIIFAVSFALAFLVNYLLFTKSSETTVLNNASNTPKEISGSTIKSTAAVKNKEELLKRLKNLVFETNSDIDFAITVYDLKTDLVFGFNDEEAQHAASITKVLTGAYLLLQVEEGKIKLNEPMGVYNVEFNLKQMVNQSNTIAWEMIDDRLGIKTQNEFANSLGLKTVNFRENLMSPRDAAKLFAKLYKEEILSEPYQRKLFSYMQNTETENLIPPAIPKGIPLYHKTGLYEGEVHDVAIIDHPTKPFILVLFSSNKLYPDYEGRAQLIQKIAAEVYSFQTQ